MFPLGLALATACDPAPSPDEGETTTGSSTAPGGSQASTTDGTEGGETPTTAGGTIGGATTDDSTMGGLETGADTTAAETTTASNPSGPVLVSIGTDRTEVGPSEELRVVAVVTDPDGIEDVIGGQLTTEDGAAIYGAFVSAAQEGSYELVVGFDQLVDLGGGILGATPVPRVLRAEFYDQSSNVVEATVEISLTCSAGFGCGTQCGAPSNDCHPVFGPSCAAGETCGPQLGSFECIPAGGGEQGAACNSTYDCGEGLGCHPSSECVGGLCCLPFCRTDEPDLCPGNHVCNPLGYSGTCAEDGFCGSP